MNLGDSIPFAIARRYEECTGLRIIGKHGYRSERTFHGFEKYGSIMTNDCSNRDYPRTGLYKIRHYNAGGYDGSRQRDG